MIIYKMDSRAVLPTRAHDHSVGWDVRAFLYREDGRPNKAILGPRHTRMINTGLIVVAPTGFYFMVCSRSGLAMNDVWVTNAPGIIDPDYRGELKVLLYNGGLEAYYVQNEDRIAQLILVPVVGNVMSQEHPLSEMDKTIRGEDGFGSTGR